jgi:hypothetical protein
MCTYRHTVRDRQRDGLLHRRKIAGVEATGDVRRSDPRHDFGVGAHAPGAERLADVAVEVDGPRRVVG